MKKNDEKTFKLTEKELEKHINLPPELLPKYLTDPQSDRILNETFEVNFPNKDKVDIADTEIIYNIPMNKINTHAKSIDISVCKIIEHMVCELDKSSKCPYKTKKLEKMSYHKLKKLHYKFIFN